MNLCVILHTNLSVKLYTNEVIYMADPFSPVTAVVTGEMNAKNAREEQKRSHRYNKELMQLSYGYGQQEQLNAARNTRAGLIAAGINPAIQDGGTFAPASGPSALTSTPAPSPTRLPGAPTSLPLFTSPGGKLCAPLGAVLHGDRHLEDAAARQAAQWKGVSSSEETAAGLGLVGVI